MKKDKVGYTQGAFDLFHVGHLNLLQNAKKYCDYLIVGVNSDRLIAEYKNKKTNICAEDRARIIEALKVVDEVHVVDTLDKNTAYNEFKFDIIFIGDDWKGNPRWVQTEKDLNELGVDLKFLPHTNFISTTELVQTIQKKENKLA